jgi:hypothetical protein
MLLSTFKNTKKNIKKSFVACSRFFVFLTWVLLPLTVWPVAGFKQGHRAAGLVVFDQDSAINSFQLIWGFATLMMWPTARSCDNHWLSINFVLVQDLYSLPGLGYVRVRWNEPFMPLAIIVMKYSISTKRLKFDVMGSARLYNIDLSCITHRQWLK